MDVAEMGGRTLEEVGQILNMTRERVRQLEFSALRAIRTHVERDSSDSTPVSDDELDSEDP
jgi:DNA-directed RNA polymerase sigma subunit (sigma70/sigma32)